MWELDCEESWAPKNWCFRTVWYWRRLLRIPWTERRSNQSILKETSPEYSLEGLMLSWNSNTLATWCEELTPWKRPWCWERLEVGGEGDNKGWGGWMVSPTRWTWVWTSSGSWWWTGKLGMLQSMRSQRVGHNWATEPNLTTQDKTDVFNSAVVIVWRSNLLCLVPSAAGVYLGVSVCTHTFTVCLHK